VIDSMAVRFNPPPNWPAPPVGWTPPPAWQPDPAWGPPPEGWQVWLHDRPQRSWVARHKVLTGIGAFVVFSVVLAAFAGAGDGTAEVASTSVTTSAPRSTPSVDASQDAAAKAKAEAEAKAKADAEAKAEAAAKAKAEAAAKARAAAALKNPASYATISKRTFAMVAKNPDHYVGKKYVIFGRVTQFDAATGDDQFRADTAGQQSADWYDYDVNSLVMGDATMLSNVVEDDIVKMYVEVVGSFSYDTQIGGSTTVPAFKVNIVKVIGSSS
jgi:hypothetical protein